MQCPPPCRDCDVRAVDRWSSRSPRPRATSERRLPAYVGQRRGRFQLGRTPGQQDPLLSLAWQNVRVEVDCLFLRYEEGMQVRSV